MPITYGFIIIVLLALIVEVLSIALKITGLDIDKARFQVVSIITHTGFTTKESELITQHPTRRKIAMVLMLISYVGAALLISIIVNALRNQETFLYFALYVTLGLFILRFILRRRYLVHKFESFLEKLLRRRMKIYSKYRSVEEVLHLNDKYGVVDFVIDEGNVLVGVSLAKSKLKENYIQVLNIDKGSHIIHFPKNDFVFSIGDKVLVYGQIEKINEFILEQKRSNLDQ